MGTHEDPTNHMRPGEHPSHTQLRLEDELRKERQVNEPLLRQEAQEALEMYDLAIA